MIEKITDDDFDSKIIDDRLVESKIDLVSVSDIISESLVEIQQFRHQWSSKIYENAQKT